MTKIYSRGPPLFQNMGEPLNMQSSRNRFSAAGQLSGTLQVLAGQNPNSVAQFYMLFMVNLEMFARLCLTN